MKATWSTGPPSPSSIAVEQDDFRATIIGAWGSLVDAGADTTSIVAFASASTVAWELAHTTTDGVPIHADGPAPMVGPGVRLVAAPSLSGGETLVVDTSRTFLVVRNDFQVDFSEHASFGTDGTPCRVKGRFSVACPHPEKSLRVIESASWSPEFSSTVVYLLGSGVEETSAASPVLRRC